MASRAEAQLAVLPLVLFNVAAAAAKNVKVVVPPTLGASLRAQPGLGGDEQLDHQLATGPAVDDHVCGADGGAFVEVARWARLGGVLNFYHREAA